MNQGGAKKALRRFVASFDASAIEHGELGTCVPCRSYRNLKCLFEFAEMQQQLDGAVSKQAVAMIHAQWKPYKAALKDLIASAKVAASRLEGALSRAAELSKRQASSALTVDTGSAGKTGKKPKVLKGGSEDISAAAQAAGGSQIPFVDCVMDSGAFVLTSCSHGEPWGIRTDANRTTSL